MYKAAAVVLFLALPALASASLRGLQAATSTPPPERVCNATELDARLEALKATPECAQAWPAFSDDVLGTPAWAAMSVEDQTKQLDDFCKGACGPAFDAAVRDWRSWCDTTRASFEPLAADDDGKAAAPSFDGFIAEFGCAKAASGGYCARVALDSFTAAPDNTTVKCGYYNSCCFGELSRVVKLGDMETRAATLDAKCPGARDSMAARCT